MVALNFMHLESESIFKGICMMVNTLTWLKMLFPPIKQEIIYFQNRRKQHQNISRMYLHLHCPCACGATKRF